MSWKQSPRDLKRAEKALAAKKSTAKKVKERAKQAARDKMESDSYKRSPRGKGKKDPWWWNI